jgi:hypothetical protein
MGLQLMGPAAGTFEPYDPRALDAGEAPVPRLLATSEMACTSGFLNLAYFVARKTESVTQVRIPCATGAGATPTLIRVGVWTAGENGELVSQVAATPNDTTLLAASATSYTKGLSAPFTKEAGTRYAVGLLVVTAASVPTIGAATFGATLSELAVAPRLSGVRVGNANLPATAPSSDLYDQRVPYIVLLP